MKSVIGKWRWLSRGFHLRDFSLWLTLFSHLIVTFGFPLPVLSRIKSVDSVAYPCQSRPCGCLSSQQCWAGDCCCFTLEEKVSWAKEHGVNPPEQVHSLIKARQGRTASTTPTKNSCCSDEDDQGKAVTAQPACCKEKRSQSDEGCCGDGRGPAVREETCCQSLESTSACDADEKIKSACDQTGVQFVVGFFAQKCRGQGPLSLCKIDPAIVPVLAAISLANLECAYHITPCSDATISVTHSPPTRPPRTF